MRSFLRIACIFLVAVWLSGCGESSKKRLASQQDQRVLVGVALPKKELVKDVIQLDGVVAPSASVNLVARVAGYLQSISFKEGQAVKQGQLLFVIEPEPYRQQLKLQRAKLDQARAEAARQENLLKENATAVASVENARSQLLQAEANLRIAQINLEYTEVRASFDGIIGRRLVDVGNYVGATAGGTVLGTIQRLRPAYVNFAINERDLLRLRRRTQSQSPDPNRSQEKAAASKLKVLALLQGEKENAAVGVLDFVDSGLNTNTGTIQLRASFPNDDVHLLPGLYAKIVIELGALRPALLIPGALVQADQQGSYVFLVDTQNKVVRRNIKTGEPFGNTREVLEGLNGDEQLLVEGIGQVVEGQTVKIKDSNEAKIDPAKAGVPSP